MNGTITERVAAGAAFLDEHDPQWWRADVERAIDLDDLDLANGDSCVLGQRCPLEIRSDNATHFGSWVWILAGSRDESTVEDWATSRGFQVSWGESPNGDRAYGRLTAEWKRVIGERRSAS